MKTNTYYMLNGLKNIGIDKVGKNICAWSEFCILKTSDINELTQENANKTLIKYAMYLLSHHGICSGKCLTEDNINALLNFELVNKGD